METGLKIRTVFDEINARWVYLLYTGNEDIIAVPCSEIDHLKPSIVERKVDPEEGWYRV